MRITCYILTICTLFLTYSCSNKKSEEKEKIIKQLLGHKLQIPTNIDSAYWEEKAIHIPVLNKPYTIVSYIDSSGCINCKIRALEWKSLKNKIDTLFPQQVSILFVIQSIKTKDIEWDFRGNDLNCPIYYDPYGLFAKTNNLPEEELYHTFLLNAQKEILLTGNPINNPSLMELYIKTLTEDSTPSTEADTHPAPLNN